MNQWFNKKMNRKRKGFTLIELVVVIAILGLLAALAIPRFTDSRANAAKTTVLADARSIYSELEIEYAEEGKYPATLAISDLAGSYTGALSYTVDDTSGVGQGYSATYTNNETTWEITFTQAGSFDIGNVVTASGS